MSDWVERDASLKPPGLIAEPLGGPGVGSFVEGKREKKHDKPDYYETNIDVTQTHTLQTAQMPLFLAQTQTNTQLNGCQRMRLVTHRYPATKARSHKAEQTSFSFVHL